MKQSQRMGQSALRTTILNAMKNSRQMVVDHCAKVDSMAQAASRRFGNVTANSATRVGFSDATAQRFGQFAEQGMYNKYVEVVDLRKAYQKALSPKTIFKGLGVGSAKGAYNSTKEWAALQMSEMEGSSLGVVAQREYQKVDDIFKNISEAVVTMSAEDKALLSPVGLIQTISDGPGHIKDVVKACGGMVGATAMDQVLHSPTTIDMVSRMRSSFGAKASGSAPSGPAPVSHEHLAAQKRETGGRE